MTSAPVTLESIQAARAHIRDAVALTPCPESIPLSEITGARIFCKLDCFQRTGSFKERGARNALSQLDAARRQRGVIAASAGNHALGLAYHGSLLGIPVTVVMPKTAPLIKSATCARLGARVVLHGETFAEARAHADALAAREQLTYIHGYDDPAIIAGQGTMALEILEQVPDVEAVVAPIGGGGLIAGLAVALKSLRPQVRVIGVEAKATASFQAALAAGRPVPVECGHTLADGLAVSIVGANAFVLARERIDHIVTVTEDQLALAILRMLELEKMVVEGAAAAPLAAFMTGTLPELHGRTCVLCFGGGNIDPVVLGRVIEKGLVADGRLGRFTAVISDRPGGLARLAQAIAETGASIREVNHDRAFAGADVSAVRVVVTIETRDHDHLASVLRHLRETPGIELPATET
ncbi:MAG: threonine ammonia-lyase [Verrucomicrobia bacterium]|nr:MAG: threonine ammonia-lyase [Verrucomicrobiota bacterium]